MSVPKRGLLLSALLLSTLLLCAGCEDRKGVQVGDSPPSISGSDIRGDSVSLAKLKGKIVLICFWTNSCCGDNVKELQSLYRKYESKGLAVLAINEMDAKKDVQSFAKTNGLTFTILTDENSELLKQYQVFAFPTYYIVDRNGVLRQRILGEIQSGKLEELILRQFDVNKRAEESYEKLHSR